LGVVFGHSLALDRVIEWEHRPDTREIITQTVELGGLECRVIPTFQQSIKHVSIVYTCNTYFAIHWSM